MKISRKCEELYNIRFISEIYNADNHITDGKPRVRIIFLSLEFL